MFVIIYCHVIIKLMFDFLELFRNYCAEVKDHVIKMIFINKILKRKYLYHKRLTYSSHNIYYYED